MDPNHVVPEDSTAAAEWSKQERKCRAIIGLSLYGAHLSHVTNTTCASAMWRSLLDIFERPTLLNQLTARRKFYTTAMIPTENVL